jgi:hypothetical protein
MKATKSVQVPLSSKLSTTASTGHVLNGLSTGSLISIGKLCDDDCAAIFSKFNVHIIKNGNIIIKGPRTPNGLWHIPFAPTPPLSSITTSAPSSISSQASSALRSRATKADLASFLHGTLFSPVTSTLVRAIQKGHFTTWPGLTTDLITRHLRPSIATNEGNNKTSDPPSAKSRPYLCQRPSTLPLVKSLPILDRKMFLPLSSIRNASPDLILIKRDASQFNRAEVITIFLRCMTMTLTPFFRCPTRSFRQFNQQGMVDYFSETTG